MKLMLFLWSISFSAYLLAEEDPLLKEQTQLIKELSLHPSQTHFPISEELKKIFFSSAKNTKIGCAISAEVSRLSQRGFENLKGKKLKFFWALKNPNGPIADYTNDGEISLNASLVLGVPGGKISPRMKMIEGFLIHEMTHAIVHDLNSRALMTPYDSASKLNELLAYKVQGEFIEELEASGEVYDERIGTPIWDQRSMVMIATLKNKGINSYTDPVKARNILTDLYLDAETDEEIQRATSLMSFYDFLNSSDDKEGLWTLNESNSPKVQSSRHLYEIIKKDLQSKEFHHFFSYLRNRIPFYAHYPDLPGGINTPDEIRAYIKKLDQYLEDACQKSHAPAKSDG